MLQLQPTAMAFSKRGLRAAVSLHHCPTLGDHSCQMLHLKELIFLVCCNVALHMQYPLSAVIQQVQEQRIRWQKCNLQVCSNVAARKWRFAQAHRPAGKTNFYQDNQQISSATHADEALPVVRLCLLCIRTMAAVTCFSAATVCSFGFRLPLLTIFKSFRPFSSFSTLKTRLLDATMQSRKCWQRKNCVAEHCYLSAFVCCHRHCSFWRRLFTYC